MMAFALSVNVVADASGNDVLESCDLSSLMRSFSSIVFLGWNHFFE